jgi:hypothetical protein
MTNLMMTIYIIPNGFGKVRLCASDPCQLDIK